MNVKPSQIVWFPSQNYGRERSLFDDEQARCAKAVILRDGWLDGCPVSVVELTPDEVKQAVALRQAQWDALKLSAVETVFGRGDDKVVAAPSDVLRVFEGEYTNKGKIVHPKYGGVYAFQRGEAILLTLVLRWKLGIKGDFEIPVNVKTFATLSERVAECVRENTSKTSGLRVIDGHWPTLWKASKAFFDAKLAEGKNVSEAEVIRLITSGAVSKRGTGGKLYALLTLDKRFPKLGIAGKMEGNDGQKFAQALGQKELREYEVSSRVPEKAKSEESAVEAYLANPKDPATVIPTVKPRKDALEFADKLSNQLVRRVIHAVYDAKLVDCNAFEKFAEQCNALLK